MGFTARLHTAFLRFPLSPAAQPHPVGLLQVAALLL